MGQKFTYLISKHNITEMYVKTSTFGLCCQLGIHTTAHYEVMFGIFWVIEKGTDWYIIHRVFLLKNSQDLESLGVDDLTAIASSRSKHWIIVTEWYCSYLDTFVDVSFLDKFAALGEMGHIAIAGAHEDGFVINIPSGFLG